MSKPSTIEKARARVVEVFGEGRLAGSRSSVAGETIAAMLTGRIVDEADIHHIDGKEEQAGRVIHHVRNVLGVPVRTRNARTEFACYSMTRMAILRFMNPELQPAQEAEQLARAALRRAIKDARKQIKDNNAIHAETDQKVFEIAKQTMPDIESGVLDSDADYTVVAVLEGGN